MSAVKITPPDGAEWSLDVEPTADGVRLLIAVPEIAPGTTAVALAIDRAEARTFAREILAAAGDATERTFPRPSLQDGING